MTPEEQDWFVRDGEGICIPSAARQLVRFLEPMSFVDGNPGEQFDAVLVMNALTYVTVEEQARTISRLADYTRQVLALTAFHPDSIRDDLVRSLRQFLLHGSDHEVEEQDDDQQPQRAQCRHCDGGPGAICIPARLGRRGRRPFFPGTSALKFKQACPQALPCRQVVLHGHESVPCRLTKFAAVADSVLIGAARQLLQLSLQSEVVFGVRRGLLRNYYGRQGLLHVQRNPPLNRLGLMFGLGDLRVGERPAR